VISFTAVSRPGWRDPAPPLLEPVQAFVNTNDIEERTDKLRSRTDLRDWLAEHGLLEATADVTADEFERAIALREAIRELGAGHNHLPADTASAMARLNEATERAGLVPALDADEGLRLAPRARGVDGALGLLLAAIYASIAEGSWERMKTCECDDCRWLFYDASKNRNGRWCHSAVCGTRERSRRAYQRRRNRTA
jgi:predicted RNA-binding Zn ribbon-like protein